MDMQHCVIALIFDGHYISVRCDYSEGDEIKELLSLFHNSEFEAHSLISKGDIADLSKTPISFYSDLGYSWAQVKPVVHESSAQFAAYSLAVGATHIYEFYEGAWEEIELSSEQEIYEPGALEVV